MLQIYIRSRGYSKDYLWMDINSGQRVDLSLDDLGTRERNLLRFSDYPAMLLVARNNRYYLHIRNLPTSNQDASRRRIVADFLITADFDDEAKIRNTIVKCMTDIKKAHLSRIDNPTTLEGIAQVLLTDPKTLSSKLSDLLTFDLDHPGKTGWTVKDLKQLQSILFVSRKSAEINPDDKPSQVELTEDPITTLENPDDKSSLVKLTEDSIKTLQGEMIRTVLPRRHEYVLCIIENISRAELEPYGFWRALYDLPSNASSNGEPLQPDLPLQYSNRNRPQAESTNPPTTPSICYSFGKMIAEVCAAVLRRTGEKMDIGNDSRSNADERQELSSQPGSNNPEKPYSPTTPHTKRIFRMETFRKIDLWVGEEGKGSVEDLVMRTYSEILSEKLPSFSSFDQSLENRIREKLKDASNTLNPYAWFARRFYKCKFEGCDFSNIDTLGVLFEGCIFKDVNFSGARLFLSEFRHHREQEMEFVSSRPPLIAWSSDPKIREMLGIN